MRYRLVQPPFSGKFDEMSVTQAKEYGRWFHAVMPERIHELAQAVRTEPKLAGWEPTYSPESLEAIDEWLLTQLADRPLTEAEKDEFLAANVILPLKTPMATLSRQSASVAFDVGMYLGGIAVKHLPGARWDQVLKHNRNADYGQPVVTGFGPVPLNPIRIAFTAMFSLLAGKRSDLPGKYRYWANNLVKSR